MVTVCVYCEENEHPLTHYFIRSRRVLLCEACYNRFAPASRAASEVDMDDFIDFPPGVVQIGHECPVLLLAGHTEEDATLTLILEEEGLFLVAECPHCGVKVRSLKADPELDDNDELDY